jgi:inward rectifier potassium channel
VHPITPESPFFGKTPDEIAKEEMEIIISMHGLDGTTSQTIHARHSYVVDEVKWNARFVDVFATLPDGRRAVDYARFHEWLPLEKAA